jgi:hypothetical protein
MSALRASDLAAACVSDGELADGVDRAVESTGVAASAGRAHAARARQPPAARRTARRVDGAGVVMP